MTKQSFRDEIIGSLSKKKKAGMAISIDSVIDSVWEGYSTGIIGQSIIMKQINDLGANPSEVLKNIENESYISDVTANPTLIRAQA